MFWAWFTIHSAVDTHFAVTVKQQLAYKCPVGKHALHADCSTAHTQLATYVHSSNAFTYPVSRCSIQCLQLMQQVQHYIHAWSATVYYEASSVKQNSHVAPP